MKIKILVHIPKSEIGTMVDLRAGEVMAMDDEVAEKLIKKGKAQFEF